MKIIFSGGGTLGPVTPLLAIAEAVKPESVSAEFVWIGTQDGPERALVTAAGMGFVTIPAGKLRRYFSLLNFVDVFKIVWAFFLSLAILWRERPDACVSAGGFVSVPVHWAAWCLGIPTWIHQQDIEIGLANRLMVPVAALVTTALESQVAAFPKYKTVWLGNPVRKAVREGNAARARELFHLQPHMPVLFATGGGTGSQRVNEMIVEAVQHLQQHCEIVHLSGKERPKEAAEYAAKIFNHYHAYQFFTDEMKDAYAVAAIVVSRGGFGTLTELAALRKPAILIPKPGHQEQNVAFLAEAGAAILLDERTTNGYHLAGIIRELLADTKRREEMGEKLHALLPPAESKQLVSMMRRLVRQWR